MHGPTTADLRADGTTVAAAIRQLSIVVPSPTLIVVGYAAQNLSDAQTDALELCIRRVVAFCAAESVVVVTGGTDAGVMAAVGRAARHLEVDVTLVGVAPARKVVRRGSPGDYDDDAAEAEPSHMMILTAGDKWGDESADLVTVAEVISGATPPLMLAIGGNAGTDKELDLASRRRWPVIAITGVGGASEKIAGMTSVALSPPHPESPQIRSRLRRRLPASGDSSPNGRSCQSSTQRAHAERGAVAACDVEGVNWILRALHWRLSRYSTLREAWVRFATADFLASANKRPTERRVLLVLALSFLTAIAAVVSAWASRQAPLGEAEALLFWLKLVSTVLPAVAVVLLATGSHSKAYGTWVEYRSAAEALLGEVYRHRTGAVPYKGLSRPDRALTTAIAAIEERCTGLGLGPRDQISPMWPPQMLFRIPEQDFLLNPLTVSEYDLVRVEDQLAHYQDRARSDERRARLWAVVMFSLSGVASVMLALSWREPGAIFLAAGAAGAASAILGWRQYKQRELIVKDMLATATALRATRRRWLAMGFEDHVLSQFAGDVESVLAAEHGSWQRVVVQAHQSSGEARS